MTGKVFFDNATIQHPGGEEVLMDSAGRDATSDFEDVGHSEDARKLMKKYLVGKLDTTSAPNAVATTRTALSSAKRSSGSDM